MNFGLALLIMVLPFPFSILIARKKHGIALEMERVNRLGDWLRKEQLKRNRTFREMLDRKA